MNQDHEHLRLLSIFHYVLGGFACLLPLLSLIYIGMGAMILSGKLPSSHGAHGSPSSDVFGGWFFIAFGALFFVAGVVGAVLNFLAGRALARRERRTLCLVVAGLNCLHMPLGTLLGVFTFIVLARPSVQTLFNPAQPEPAPSPWRQGGPGHGLGTSPFSNPNP